MPQIINAYELSLNEVTRNIGEKWVPARPVPFYPGLFGFRKRMKYAWMVFTGKCDALIWPGQ